MSDSSSSSSNSTIQEIINAIIAIFGTEYKVINAYDNDDEIDLNGVITVNAGQYQCLHHGDSQDYQLTITVSGQFLTAQDVNQAKINAMFDYIRASVDVSAIIESIDDCAGIVIGNGGIQSDGESNNCFLNFDLFICQD